MKFSRLTIAIVGLSVAVVGGGVAFAAGTGGSTSPPSAAGVARSTGPVDTGMATPPTNPTASTFPSSTSTPPNSPTTATLHTATATVGGATETVLVDGKGQPLYFYKPDTATRSMVTGELAALWPPLVGSAPTESGATGALSTAATTNGLQVTYNGHFLYTFVEDSPGWVTGQGVQNFFVATPGISAIPSAGISGARGTTATPSASGYGY